jgi:hypothetical protein
MSSVPQHLRRDKAQPYEAVRVAVDYRLRMEMARARIAQARMIGVGEVSYDDLLADALLALETASRLIAVCNDCGATVYLELEGEVA